MSESDLGGVPAVESTALPPPPPPPPAGAVVGTASVVTGRRILAGLIDMVPLVILATAMGDRATDAGFRVELQGLQVLWWLLASIAYYAVAELATGTSPGKAATGLCVRNDNAEAPTRGQIAVRSALRIVDVMPLMYLVGVITSLASSKRKRLGDMAAGTVVLQRSEVGEPRPSWKNVASLVGLVVLTVGAAVGLWVTPETGETVGAFDLEEHVIPYAEEVIDDAMRPLSAEALRSHLAPGIVSDDDLDDLFDSVALVAGSMTSEYRVEDHHFDEYEIPPNGETVEAVSLRILGEFEERDGQLILAIADVDGELKLIGINFQL